MLKCSSFLPDFSAAGSHRGFSPRPTHVQRDLPDCGISAQPCLVRRLEFVLSSIHSSQHATACRVVLNRSAFLNDLGAESRINLLSEL